MNDIYICFLNPDMYMLKTDWYLDWHMTYIFKWDNFVAFFENVCICPGLKYETLNFAR